MSGITFKCRDCQIDHTLDLDTFTVLGLWTDPDNPELTTRLFHKDGMFVEQDGHVAGITVHVTNKFDINSFFTDPGAILTEAGSKVMAERGISLEPKERNVGV